MPFCESIAKIAKEVEAQLTDISEAERKRFWALKNMPKHFEAKRLDQFDSEFKAGYSSSEIETRKSYKAIEIIAELAYENMYVEFSDKDTQSTYSWLVNQLSNLGIVVPSNLDMEGW